MKWKYIIILMLMIATIQIVSGAISEAQISTDNITFVSVDNIVYGGDIDGGIATAQNLNCSTEYFFRARNGTSDWGYDSITTDSCGVNEMELAIIIILLGAAAILIYAALNVKDDLLKTLFMVLSFIMIVLGLNAATNLAGITSTLQNTLEIGYFIFLYGGLFFMIIYFIILFIQNVFTNKSKLDMGEGDDEEN